jgi:hypothetical protein
MICCERRRGGDRRGGGPAANRGAMNFNWIAMAVTPSIRGMMGDSLFKFSLRRRHCEATEAS